MERIEVKSSQVKSIGWEPNFPDSETDNGVLEIEFTSLAVYEYKNVPYNVYRLFLAAESKGHHFAVFIRPCYEYVCTVPKPKQEQKEGDSHGENTNPDLTKDLKKSIRQAKDKKAAKERADRHRSSSGAD